VSGVKLLFITNLDISLVVFCWF